MDGNSLEPTIAEAATRYWWVLLLGTILGALIGFSLTQTVLNDQLAEARVIIEDPGASQVFDTGFRTQPERYLASQVAILESPDMAQVVATRLRQEGHALGLREILDSRRIVTRSDTDLITIQFRHPDDQAAIAFANGFVEAYLEYRESVTDEAFDSAVAELDESIAAVDRQVADLNAQIEDVTEVAGVQELRTLISAALSRYVNDPQDEDAADTLEEILGQLQALQAIQNLQAENIDLSLMLAARTDLMERRSELIIRRDQLAVDAALTSTGIVAVSRSTEAEASVGLRLAAFVAVLGLIAGALLAYRAALRNRTFAHRSAPEATLQVPMLAEVPEFDLDDFETETPVLSDPMSPTAESFRFAASALTARLGQTKGHTRPTANSIAITSALVGEGKTVVTANTGLAVATRGKSVVIIDADFGNPALTKLLLGDSTERRLGLTDVAEGPTTLREAAVRATIGEGHWVDVLTRGTIDIPAADFFGSAVTRELFRLIELTYDYVLIDCPPLLQVSYASSVAGLADAVVSVIPHNSPVVLQQEVLKRLKVVDANLIGYIYNKAPRRADWGERRGSIQDVLGRGVQ